MRPALAVASMLLLSWPAQAFDPPFNPLAAATIEQRPGAAVPLDLALKDEAGGSVTLRGLAQGKPLLLVPVQFNCPNICGITLAGLVQAIAAQPLRAGTNFSLVVFGIDPREGTKDAAAKRARLLAEFPEVPAAGIHAVTVSPTDIAAVTAALGYRYAWDPDLQQFDHVAATAVLAPDGRLTHWLYGIAPDPGDLKLALVDAGQGKIGGWTDQLLLLCYHYDPVTGRYSSVIWTALRILASGCVALLVLLIAGAFLRDHRASRSRSP